MTFYETFAALVSHLEASSAEHSSEQRELLSSAQHHLHTVERLSGDANTNELLAEDLLCMLDEREELERQMLEGAPGISLMLCGFEKVAEFASSAANLFERN